MQTNEFGISRFHDSLNNFNVKQNRITNLYANIFGYAHIAFHIIFCFSVDFDEDADKVLTTSINVIATAKEIHNDGRYAQNVCVSAVYLHQPLNEETGNCVVIDKRYQQFVGQKICCWVPVSDVHIIAGVNCGHAKCAATDIDEHKHGQISGVRVTNAFGFNVKFKRWRMLSCRHKKNAKRKKIKHYSLRVSRNKQKMIERFMCDRQYQHQRLLEFRDTTI